MAERDGDFVRQAFVARGGTEILLFTARGSVHSVQVKDFPRGTRSSRGKQISDLVELDAGDHIVSLVPVPEFDEQKFLLFVTRDGQVKRTALSEYSNVRAGGIRAIGLAGGDEVMRVRPSLGTGGFGKRVPFTDLKRQGRAGKGMVLLPDTDRAGLLAGVLAVHPGDLGMCELASGEVVPISVESLPVKPRRGASVRIEALSGRAGPIVAVHPLRASSGEGKSETGDDGSGDAESSGAGTHSTPAAESRLDATGQDPEPEVGSEGETQAEFKL
jgi:DNA gyrase subunit A